MADAPARAFIPLNIAVLTVSDTRSLADDKSGAMLAERLTAAGHRLAARNIVTDDIEAIRNQVKSWIADAGVDVIITTGGTGFTGRDVTPDAIEPLFDKRMDGFSIAFHMLSHAKIGASTIQSRATAGLAGTTFIFCLPARPVPAATAGTASSPTNSTIAQNPATSSRSCRGSTSICGGRRADIPEREMAEQVGEYSGTDFYCDVALKGAVPLRKEYESDAAGLSSHTAILAGAHRRHSKELHQLVRHVVRRGHAHPSGNDRGDERCSRPRSPPNMARRAS